MNTLEKLTDEQVEALNDYAHGRPCVWKQDIIHNVDARSIPEAVIDIVRQHGTGWLSTVTLRDIADEQEVRFYLPHPRA